MFEIGTTLRDARIRRDISLQQAEDDTKIRVKYIQAMENEDFDVLPGGTYVKGFLRTYAEYLDLDFQTILDEFNDRFGSGDHREHLIQPPKTAKAKVPHKRQNYILVAILAVAILAVLAYLGWGSSDHPPATIEPTGTEATTGTGTQTTPAVAAVPPAETAPPAATTPTATQPATVQSLTFESTLSDNWIEVRKDTSTGEVIWADTLLVGSSKTLAADQLGTGKIVLMLGSADGLSVKLNNQVQKVTGSTTYLVTPTGLKQA
jgi:cytoskeletal protein RodZ